MLSKIFWYFMSNKQSNKLLILYLEIISKIRNKVSLVSDFLSVFTIIISKIKIIYFTISILEISNCTDINSTILVHIDSDVN